MMWRTRTEKGSCSSLSTTKASRVVTDSSFHLLECLSPEVYDVLFSTYGSEITMMTEADLTSNIKRLVV